MNGMSSRPLAAVVRRPPDSSIRAPTVDEAEKPLVSLALGEPSWPLPAVARRALATVERCDYGPHRGVSEIRAAIGAHEGAGPDSVLVTAGAQGALFALTQVFLGPGDAALVPDPGFPAYRTLIELAGAEIVPYSLGPRFELDADAFVSRLDRASGVKLAFINHPSNPTGGSAERATLETIAEACRRRGILLVADEVYRHLTLGSRSPSLRAVTDDGIVISSVSKAWGAPGLRVGWMIGDPRWLEPCRALHAAMVTSAAGPSQAAARALIEASDTVLPAARAALAVRWRAVAEAWRAETGVVPETPQGGIYLWRAVDDDVAFARRARREAGVAVVPGRAFGDRGRGFLRLAFGGPPETVAEGVRRLLQLGGLQ